MSSIFEDSNSPDHGPDYVMQREGRPLPADLADSAQRVWVRPSRGGGVFLAWRWRPEATPAEEAPELWAVSPRGLAVWAAPRFPWVHDLDDLALLEMVPLIARLNPGSITIFLSAATINLDAAALDTLLRSIA